MSETPSNIQALYSFLQENFPLAFPTSPEPKCPLARGIRFQMYDCPEIMSQFKKEDIDSFLAWYIRHVDYTYEIVLGGARINLDGVPSEPVALATRHFAKGILVGLKKAAAAVDNGDSVEYIEHIPQVDRTISF